MAAIDTHLIGGSVAIVLFPGFIFWRIFQGNRGDRFVKFALITTMLLVIDYALWRIPNIPDWIVPALWPFIGLFCFLSLFFMFLQAFRTFRDRKRARPYHAPPVNGTTRRQ